MLKSMLKPIVKAIFVECMEEYLKTDSGKKAVSRFKRKRLKLEKLEEIFNILGSISNNRIRFIDFDVAYCDHTGIKQKKTSVRGRTPAEFLHNLKAHKTQHAFFKEAILFLSYDDSDFGNQMIHQNFNSSFELGPFPVSRLEEAKQIIFDIFEDHPELLV